MRKVFIHQNDGIMKWTENLNEYDNLKHRNALDLNLRPLEKKFLYRLPKRMNSEFVVDLTASGNTQNFIMQNIISQLAARFERLSKLAFAVTESHALDEFSTDLNAYTEKMNALSEELF